MKYAVQVLRERTGRPQIWNPGIHRQPSKVKAVQFADGINQTGGTAQVVRRQNHSSSWEAIST